MRNGNELSMNSMITTFIVLILPMRNGNRLLACQIDFTEEIVLILPMRNGNILELLWFVPNTAFLSYLWGMETLYNVNEVKIKVMKFLSYLWGMETVEKGRIYFYKLPGFLSYLWGMETFGLDCLLVWNLRVLILPMRNGNLHHLTRVVSRLQGSYPTYEEWKPRLKLHT